MPSLVVSGDIDTKQTLELGPEVLRRHPVVQAGGRSPTSPSRARRRRSATSKDDPLANRPALALGYHVPKRDTPEYYAMGLIDQMLVQGADSRLYQSLVQKRGLTGAVTGGTNPLLGNMFDIKGPTLWMVWLIHDADKKADEIIEAIDEEITRLQTTPVTKAELELALVKLRSRLYADYEQFVGFGRADLLASFALFDDDPAKINRLEDEFRKVTPELIQKAAQEYLRPTNRTILTIVPKGQRRSEMAHRTSFIAVLGIAALLAGAAVTRAGQLRRRRRCSRSPGRRAAGAEACDGQAGAAEALDGKPAAEKAAAKRRHAFPAEPPKAGVPRDSRSRSRSASRSTTACRWRWCSGARCRRCA